MQAIARCAVALTFLLSFTADAAGLFSRVPFIEGTRLQPVHSCGAVPFVAGSSQCDRQWRRDLDAGFGQLQHGHGRYHRVGQVWRYLAWWAVSNRQYRRHAMKPSALVRNNFVWVINNVASLFTTVDNHVIGNATATGIPAPVLLK